MIRLQSLQRVFRVGGQTVRALDDVNLEVDDGDYLAVMGPSGSGKSTLLNIIGLLDRPTGGRYLLDRRDVTTLSDEEQASVRRENIGFVFQSYHLVPRLNAAQNVELPLVLAGVEPAERKAKVAAMLDALQLSDRAGHRPDQLSGGQRQRVAIARAMTMDPAMILADEPTGNLDRASGSEVIDILETLNRERGITLIVVTHDPELGGRASSQIAMVDGRISLDHRPEGVSA
jgi:putative ABC transport system ATP-binding protein